MIIKENEFYTGIGSRETPREISELMTDVARKLCALGMILRSGGADGADTAFENGVDDVSFKEIYLPWPGFNGRKDTVSEYSDCHIDIAKANHPSWGFLSRGARALHTRNVAQVLGEDCSTPSQFVVCWTPNGELKGGTATAMKVAYRNSIPVYNMFYEKVQKAFYELVETGKLDEDAWRTL
jgi:hypothetical protein